MKKIKLFGLGNEGDRSYFVFEKTLDFFPLFSSFLQKLKLDKPGSFYEYEEEASNLDDLNDSIENVKNDVYNIDIFYGEKRIIVVIRSEIKRDYYMQLIKEFSDLQ